jgi:hypothetical protein
MKPETIGYQTDIIKPYVEAIRQQKTAVELVAELENNWSELCPDALEQARTITDEDWQFALKNAKVEKHAQKVNELAGAILLPATILHIGSIAGVFCVPDGCAYIRLMEVRSE